MDHTPRVRGFEPEGDLRGNLDRALDRNRATVDALLQIFALDQLHHQVVHKAIVLP